MKHRDALATLPGGSPQHRAAWRFFPLAICAALLLVIGVNAGLVIAAIHTFPGSAGSDGFGLSNHYDAVLAQARRDSALGWTVAAASDSSGRAVLRVSDAKGEPLRGALVSGVASRPLGATEDTVLHFAATSPERYEADASLPSAGQWDLTLDIAAQGQHLAVTRRIVVP